MYWFSQKGEEEYTKLGLNYPKSQFDIQYENFLRITRDSPPDQTKNLIKKIIRLQVDDNGKGQEYLLWDMREERQDSIGNTKEFSREILGRYAKIAVKKEMVVDSEHRRQIKVIPDSAHQVGTLYEVPYSVDKVLEMHKLCNDTDLEIGKTQYLVQKLGARKVSVLSFNDFCYGDFEDLYEHGRITTKKSYLKKQSAITPEDDKQKKMIKNLTHRSRKMSAMPSQVNY